MGKGEREDGKKGGMDDERKEKGRKGRREEGFKGGMED